MVASLVEQVVVVAKLVVTVEVWAEELGMELE